MEQLIYSIYFTGLLNLMGEYLKTGRKVPQELIEEAREIGRRAQVPEEELNALEQIKHHGATIH